MKTLYYTASSIDGFIADPKNSLEWLFQFGESEPDDYPNFSRDVGAIAMGSTTYEWLLMHEILADAEWQGLGYATEIAEALIENAFTDMRVKKVIAHATPVNLASCKVLEKSRFRFVCREEESGNNLFEISRNPK